MQVRKMRVALAAGGLIMGMMITPFAARATTIVENFSAGSGSFSSANTFLVLGTTSINKFDPTLGTLTSVLFNATVIGSLTGSFSFAETAFLFGPPDANGERNSGNTTGSFITISGAAGSFTQAYPSNLTGSSSVAAFLEGIGTQSFSYLPQLSSGAMSVTSINGSVTFVYTPTATGVSGADVPVHTSPRTARTWPCLPQTIQAPLLTPDL